ncbi:IS3 family transposase [Spirosoma aerophilum]
MKTVVGFAKHERKGSCRFGGPMGECRGESFLKSLKSALVYQQDFQTQAMANQTIFEYTDVWYNRQRRHSALGYLSSFDSYQQVA